MKDLVSLEIGRIKKEAVPDHIRIQLGLDVLEHGEAEVADGPMARH